MDKTQRPYNQKCNPCVRTPVTHVSGLYTLDGGGLRWGWPEIHGWRWCAGRERVNMAAEEDANDFQITLPLVPSHRGV